jgi:hypothetical protein
MTASLLRRSLLQRSLVGATAVLAGLFGGPVQRANAAQARTLFDPTDATVRRVVIGNNAQGKSYVFKDEAMKRGEIWRSTPKEPLGQGGPSDPNTVLPASPAPASGQAVAEGTRWIFSSIRPSTEPMDRKTIKGWHRVSSLSYVLITNGELTLLLDEGDVVLRGGDLLVMRNAMHTWHNATGAPVGMLISQNLLS